MAVYWSFRHESLNGQDRVAATEHPGSHGKHLYTQGSFWSVLHCNSKLLKSSLYQHRNVSLPTDSCSNGPFGKSTCQKGNWLLFKESDAAQTTGRQDMLQQQLLKVAGKIKT